MRRTLEWSAIMPSVERKKDWYASPSQPPKSLFTHLAAPKLWWEQIPSRLEFPVILDHSCWTWLRPSARWEESLRSNTGEKRFQRVGRSTTTVIPRPILKPHYMDLYPLREDQRATALVSPSGCSPGCYPECRPAERFLVRWTRNIGVLSETC